MQLYRYSPIKTKEQFLEAISYVAEKNLELCEKVVVVRFPITSLTVFAHYRDEYEHLKVLLEGMGDFVGDTNGPRIALHEPIVLGDNAVTHLRVRNPDPYRAQVGCVDFDVSNYVTFKKDFLASHLENLRLLVRHEYELIEFFDPDYDVLAYVLSDPPRSRY